METMASHNRNPSLGSRPTWESIGDISASQSIVAYFRHWRYRTTQVIACFCCMYLGWIALTGGLRRSALVITTIAVLSATCALIAIFLINDACDREIDRIVHPERPIPRGLSAWQHILAFGIFLLALSVALSLLVGWYFAATTALLVSLATLHYGYLKHRLRIPGFSEIVTPLVSALFPVTAFVVFLPLKSGILLAVVSFIYFADLSQDLLGGIHDRPGDYKLGVGTVALTYGPKVAFWISFSSFLMSVAAGLAVYVRGHLAWLYLSTLTVFSVIMLWHYFMIFRAADDDIAQAAGRANHVGGFYFFIVSASILPDLLL